MIGSGEAARGVRDARDAMLDEEPDAEVTKTAKAHWSRGQERRAGLLVLNLLYHG